MYFLNVKSKLITPNTIMLLINTGKAEDPIGIKSPTRKTNGRQDLRNILLRLGSLSSFIKYDLGISIERLVTFTPIRKEILNAIKKVIETMTRQLIIGRNWIECSKVIAQ